VNYILNEIITSNNTIVSRFYESIDPQYADSIFQKERHNLERKIIDNAVQNVLFNFKLFFSNTRKGLRLILREIDGYWNRPEKIIVLETQIKSMKEMIMRQLPGSFVKRDGFTSICDALLSFYSSYQDENLFPNQEIINESDFHKKVYEYLHLLYGERIQNKKKVGSGNVDFLIFNYPLDVKVEDKLDEIEKIFDKYKNQIVAYCYKRKSIAGFLFAYDNTAKTSSFSKKDLDIYKIEEYFIIVLILRGNFPFLSKMA